MPCDAVFLFMHYIICFLLQITYFQLPDSHVVKLGGERFEAPEVLLQPHLINMETLGVAELLFTSTPSRWQILTRDQSSTST